MAKIYASSANYVAAATTKTIHTGPGKLRGIIISTSAGGSVTFYDNTSAAIPILLILNVLTGVPVFLNFDNLLPLVFVTGLTVVTSASTIALVITEA